LGAAGEGLAARFLSEQGLVIVARNVEVGRGELDLLVLDGRTRVVVEVRTSMGRLDPIDAVGESKRRRVRSLAARVGAGRVDFVGVGIDRRGVTFHWVPGCG
jgi:putative endonuclease